MDEQIRQAIEQLKRGEEEGFNRIYAYTHDRVYFRAKQLMKNEEDACDLVQIVYMEAYKGIHTLQSPEALMGWLDSITYRQGMKLFRKKKDVLLQEEMEELLDELEDNNIRFMPELSADRRASAEIVRGIIEELPELQRTAVVMYYYDSMEVGQIADYMECSANTVKSRLNYARKYIRERIEEKEKKEGFRLHALGLPLIWAAVKAMSDEMTLTAQAAQEIYGKACAGLKLRMGGAADGASAGEAGGTAGGASAGGAGGAAGIGAKIAALGFPVKVLAAAAAVLIAAGAAAILYAGKSGDGPEDTLLAESRESVQAPESVPEEQQEQESESEPLTESAKEPDRETEAEDGGEAVDAESGQGEVSGFVSWEDSGLEDHVMLWSDEGLEARMRDLTEITDRDILLSDVWEMESFCLSYSLFDNGVYEVNDITALGELTNLKEINLNCNCAIYSGGGVSDLSCLSGLVNLESLVLGETARDIEGISVLKELPKLKTLSLAVSHFSDTAALQDLTGLQSLDLGHTDISDISALQKLTQLESLDLSNNDIGDISALQGLTELKFLVLRRCGISDITALKNLTRMEGLDLRENEISDIGPLEGMTNMVRLCLDNSREVNRQKISDISALRNMTKLQRLTLDDVGISDISPLAGLTELEMLYLEENNISDIQALKNMTHMRYLRLSYNQISDISALSGMTELEELELSGNPIADYSPATSLGFLQEWYE